MTDQSDQATEREELDRKVCLSQRKPVLPIINKCYNCGEQIDRIFCDHECNYDYHRRLENMKGID